MNTDANADTDTDATADGKCAYQLWKSGSGAGGVDRGSGRGQAGGARSMDNDNRQFVRRKTTVAEEQGERGELEQWSGQRERGG